MRGSAPGPHPDGLPDPALTLRLAQALAEPPVDAASSRLVEALGHGTATAVDAPRADLRAVLAVRPFRNLWLALSFASLGDWLGLLAQTSLAAELGSTSGAGAFAGSAYAIGGVLIVRLLPSLLLGPFAGAVADRFDRRVTMVVADLVRMALFASIPFVHSLLYLGLVTFFAELFGLFWNPAKDATVPNLVSREQLEPANTLSLIVTYGTAPIASGLFALLSATSRGLGSVEGYFHTNPVDLALYVDAASFLVSALVVARLPATATTRRVRPVAGEVAATGPVPVRRRATGVLRGLLADTAEGWRFIGSDPTVRGLVVGIVGAFAAVGAAAAVGRVFVKDLHGADAAYGLLFGAVFLGLASGMGLGRVFLPGFSRRRLFGLAITGAGATLAVTAVVPQLLLALLGMLVTGAFAGLAWVTGYTLLGGEVADSIRARTFAIVQSLVRITLFATLAAAPFLVGVIGQHSVRLPNHARIRADGATFVLLAGGLVAAAVGVLAYRQLDDRRGIPLGRDLLAAARTRRTDRRGPAHPGLLVAFEGGEGAGKSTQLALLATWLRAAGHEVVVTREPGATALGERLREVLLDPASPVAEPTELLLYAADRAQHVAQVVLPALCRGAVVLTDRYVDSTYAYQGRGRGWDPAVLDQLADLATQGLVADATVVLDIDPPAGLARAAGRGAGQDRLEGEPPAFHARVQLGFLERARSEPRRYVVVASAELTVDEVADRVRTGLVRVVGAARLTRQLPQEPAVPSPTAVA